MPVGIKTIYTVIEPIAGKFFVIGGISGIERESQNEEKTQQESGEECRREVLIESFGEHDSGRRGIRIAQTL